MAKAKNAVISGAYRGGKLKKNLNRILVSIPMQFGFAEISSKTVEGIEIIDSSSKKSTGSIIKRGIVGAVIAGPAGAVIGGVTGKTKDVYHVLIHFKDGQQSLVELDNEMYNNLLKVVF